ncbi:MAG: YoaK family protein [Clostridium sp.]
MKKVSNKHMSESLKIGVILAITGGFLDAYTFLSRGKVFANAQTGNIVLLGTNLFQGEYKKALTYLIPVSSFIVGVFISEFIKLKFKNNEKIHWRQIIVFIEIFLLVLVAFMPENLNNLANIIVSFICAMQVESFRKINGISCATTMCTGNLRSGTELLFKYIKTKEPDLKEKCINYYGIDLLFILGAGLGALFTNTFKEKAVLFCCVTLFIGFIVMFIKEDILIFKSKETEK